LPSDKNVDALEEMKEKLSSNSVLISTGFTGLDVATMTDLRQKLREENLEYRVVKNTIASLAADQIGSPQIKEVLAGPTGLVLGNGDPVAAAKLLTEYLRSTRIAMPLNGAVMEGQVMSAQEVNALGALPPKPVLMSMFLGQLSGVVARLARVLNSPIQSLAIVLDRSTGGAGTASEAIADNATAASSPDSAAEAIEPGADDAPDVDSTEDAAEAVDTDEAAESSAAEDAPEADSAVEDETATEDAESTDK
jgi:large subunit ribosomal protein L10